MTITTSGVTPLIEVFDMPRSVAFYRDVLGFEVVATSGQEDFGWCMLTLGGATLMLNTAYDDGERPEVPDQGRVSGHADTSLFFGCDNVDQVYEHIRAKGYAVKEPAVTYYGQRQVWTKDPDGFKLCFQCPVSA